MSSERALHRAAYAVDAAHSPSGATAGIDQVQVDVIELNEASAAQALARIAHRPETDRQIVNQNGDAIDHPPGSPGSPLWA